MKMNMNGPDCFVKTVNPENIPANIICICFFSSNAFVVKCAVHITNKSNNTSVYPITPYVMSAGVISNVSADIIAIFLSDTDFTNTYANNAVTRDNSGNNNLAPNSPK